MEAQVLSVLVFILFRCDGVPFRKIPLTIQNFLVDHISMVVGGNDYDYGGKVAQ